jgi:hypothetical protein
MVFAPLFPKVDVFITAIPNQSLLIQKDQIEDRIPLLS